jgi:hypothetical protein
MILVYKGNCRCMCLLVLCLLSTSVLLSSCTGAATTLEPPASSEQVSTTVSVPVDDTSETATERASRGTEEGLQYPATVSPTVANHPGLDLVDFTSDNFVGSGNCALCHSNLTDQAGNDVSNDSHWRSAMMANSARDPFWQAKVSSEVTRNPDLKDVIEDKCANCHTPMAHTELSAKGEMVELLEDGLLQPDNPFHASAIDGVSCTLCHQIQNLNLGEKESFSGGYGIDTEADPPDRPVFGPFTDQFGQLMIATVGYTPMYGEQTLDSGLCATCHTLYTPFVDASGQVLGEFPEQTPYLEWENSVYGDGIDEDRICQNCHMPEAEGAVVISNMPRGGQLSPRSPFARHHFVGGNTFMLKLLQSRVEELALTASTDYFGATIARTLDQLQQNTAEISIVEAIIEGDTAKILVRVENKAGHKFPTGFPSRRAFIHFVIMDSSGDVIFESGMSENDGRIIGVDSDENLLAYEPHYDVISSPDQVQVYQSVMQNSDGEVTYTLLRGAHYVKDNRLLPEGFDKKNVMEDIAVYGAALEDGNFTGGTDQLQYLIDIEGHSGPFTVTAELLYQSISYPFIHDFSGDDTDLVVRFVGFFNNADRSPVLIAMTQKTVE